MRCRCFVTFVLGQPFECQHADRHEYQRLRADFAVTENYPHTAASTHYAALACPLIAFVGNDEVALSLMEEWQRYTRNNPVMHVFPGGHFYLQENTEGLLKAIRETLKTEPSHDV